MTYADTTINALAGIAYAYAVELNEAAIHADHDELEQLARQITDKLKAQLRVALEEHQAAAPAANAAQALVAWISNETLEALALHRSQGFPAGGHVLALQRGSATVPLYTHLAPQQAASVAELGALQAEIAGHEAANLHLSAMVDELRELLQDAKRSMTELHLAAIPDESTEGVPAIVPPEAFRKFVDAHAMLCFCLHQRGHNPPKEEQHHG